MNRTSNNHEDPRLAEILDIILKFAAGDFTARGTLAGDDSALDSVMAGINNLGEELAAKVADNKRTMQALSDSEAQFSSLFEAIPDGICMADAQTRRFRMANDAICRMLGYSLDEFLNLTVDDIHPRKDLPNVARQFDRQLKGEINLARLPVKRKDGTVFQADITATPATVDGQLCITGVVRDVTERIRADDEIHELNRTLQEKVRQLLEAKDELVRKELNLQLAKELAERQAAEQELHSANEQLSVLLDSLPIAVYRCAAGGDYAVAYMSQNVVSFTGYTARNFMDQPDLWFSHIHPDDVPRISGEMELLMEKGRHVIEYRWRKADDNYLWLRDSLRLVRLGDGSPNYLVGMWQNITEDTLAAEALRKANDDLSLFRRLLDNSSDAIEVIDPVTLRFLDVNETACRELGYSREELLTMSVQDIDPDMDTDTVLMVEEQLRESGSARFETTHRRKDGAIFPVEVNMGTVILDKPYGLAIVRDITERKQTTQALEESEHRFRAILDATMDGILVVDAQSQAIVMGNRAICDMLGYELEELMRLGIADITQAAALPEVQRQFERQAKGEISVAPEIPVQRKDGSIFFADVSGGAPMLLAGRSLMVGVVHDITERKQVEEQIREQQELTTKIIETIPLRVFWKDRDLRYLGSNTLFAKDAGVSRPEQLIGKTDFELGWTDFAETYRADDQRVMDSDTPKLSFEEPQITPTGERAWIRTSKVPLQDDVGEVFGLLGTYENVTDQVDAQQQLERHNAVFRAQQETSPDAILVVDDNARIVSYNRRFVDLWKVPEKLVGARVDEPVLRTIVAQMLDPETFLARVKYLYEHKSEKGHEELQLKDGRVVDRYSSPVLGSDGMYFGRVWYFRDISERKQAEEQILKLNRDLEGKVEARTRQLIDAQDELVRKEKLALLGQVAGSVGHELRNPLGVMNNAVYFLQTVLTDADATTREYLEIIKVEIAEADRIVADLLDSVRTKPPHPAAVGVREVIDQTLRQNPVPAAMTVTLEIPAALPPVWVDAMQIQQVFRNLISNGVEAMTEGGTLTIGAVENSRDGMVSVSVRDSGSGMPPEVQARLFQPLFTTKARGIGLGLVVAKNLTQSNGGTITVESAVGRGTTFTVVLPVNSAGEVS